MSKRVGENHPDGNLPRRNSRETPHRESDGVGGLLPGRWAAILGASFMIAGCAGTLAYIAAYYAVGRPAEAVAAFAAAALMFGTAFAGSVRLLNSIIA